ncbi:MAG: hydroxyacylglutathione hydrolase [Pseudomonadota bacterium]
MTAKLDIHIFPCLSDNYGFLAHDPASGDTLAIDTPDGDRYLEVAENKGWTITEIWNTHWHPDHTGGNLKVKEATGCPITGPIKEADKIPGIDRTVGGGDQVSFARFKADVLDVPGHTLGHIAFHLGDAKLAFVGDALFALGCGRVFEGDMAMMWDSLKRLRALPADTTIYCAHEYTQGNARFAESIDPGNDVLKSYVQEIDAKRAAGEPTVPTTLAREIPTNPFLRADNPAMQAAMGFPGDAVATFAEIRGRKDRS